jgi:hypothetical protein
MLPACTPQIELLQLFALMGRSQLGDIRCGAAKFQTSFKKNWTRKVYSSGQFIQTAERLQFCVQTAKFLHGVLVQLSVVMITAAE